MSAEKRPVSPGAADNAESAGTSKKPRSQPPTLHTWLHPDEPPPLRTHSPPLHYSSSTFLSFAISFTPPPHITSEAALAKECRRIVREINVPLEVGDLVMESDEGAFEHGEGRVVNLKGKERAREPDHRIWAVRSVCLNEGRDGTQGEDDYQLLEVYNDDGEKFGGDRITRVLREEGAFDILCVVLRWYGGDMIGPIRFQHIGLTAKTAVTDLMKAAKLKDLREALVGLDEELATLKRDAEGVGTNASSQENGGGHGLAVGSAGKKQTYEDVDDIPRLERLVKARTKTKEVWEKKVSWAGQSASNNDGASHS